MKSPSTASNLPPAILLISLASIFALAPTPSFAGTPPPPPVLAIPAEADTNVSSVDRGIPQGTSLLLAVGHDQVATARSYLRFPLSDLDPLRRIISARIDLQASLVAGGSVGVHVHRSQEDGWVENTVHWATQPGFDAQSLGSATVSGFGPVNYLASLPIAVRDPITPQPGTWDFRSDLREDDPKVTFALKAAETFFTGSAQFASREVFDPPLNMTPQPTLVVRLRGPGEVQNGNAENGLDNWQTSGDVEAVPNPREPGSHFFQFTASSEARMWQEIDTPDSLFAVAFGGGFSDPGGTLSVRLDDTALWSMDAPDEVPDGGFFVIMVSDRALQGQYDRKLTFVYDGPTGSRAGFENIEIFAVPEPELSIQLEESGGGVTISYFAEEGAAYRLETSRDLTEWEPHGQWIQGFDLPFSETFPVENNRERFFRLTISVVEDTFEDIELENSGFEEPELQDNRRGTNVPGWTTSGIGVAAYNPPATRYPDEAPEGENVASLRENNSMSQMLGETLQPHRLYTLNAVVGNQLEQAYPSGSPPDIRLKAGGVVLTPFYSESPMPADGEFAEWVRDFLIPPDHPALGEPLEVILFGGSSPFGSFVEFDDVGLSFF